MKKKKLTPAQKNARSRQRRRDKQYRELITNFKNIYNELQFGAIAGQNAPTAEKLLKSVGTSSGLTKPTKKSIQALKKLQSRQAILSRASLVMPTVTTEQKKAKEKVQERAAEEIERDRRRRTRPTKPKKEKINTEHYDEIGQPEVPVYEYGVDTSAIEVVLEQIQRVVDRISTSNYYTNGDLTVLAVAEDLTDRINSILGLGTEEQIELLNLGAKRYFLGIRQVEYQELYEDAPVLRAHLFGELVKTMTSTERGQWDTKSQIMDGMNKEVDYRVLDWFW